MGSAIDLIVGVGLHEPGGRDDPRGWCACTQWLLFLKQARRPCGADPPPMFFFLSNKLGCLGSALVSLGLTLLLLFLFNLF
jgi:hypothetical protein